MNGYYSKIRVGFVFILLAMTFVVFFARLVNVQVVQGDRLREKARRQYLESIELPAARGEIYDIRGNKVAVNTYFRSLFAYPLTPENVDQSYRLLARIFGKKEKTMRRAYTLEPKKFRWIKRGLTDQEAAQFEALDNACGLFMREEPTRRYPYGDVGRAILGFVDIDNLGRSGVELVMNDALTGAPGRSLIQKDGMGDAYQIQQVPLKEPVPGYSVVLTIDWVKQQIVEEELAKAVFQFKAKAGMAVFLDPHTGAILAAVDCDSAQADTSRQEDKPENKPVKLNAVTDTYEPGSIFKLITAAAALEGNRVSPTQSFDAENGLWVMGKHSLRDDHKYSRLTFREAFEFSSNIVMGKIANEIGADKVFAMAEKLGFGRKTKCGLNGESDGILRKPKRWSQFTTATFAIGHGVSVTPLQMAQAFAVVASGGYLAQPHIIAGCINDQGQVVQRHVERPVKILDDKVVAMLDSFLRGVVERGTGKPIGDAPFAIAAKTGTAEKPNLESGGYNKNLYMASFAGYFPADSPLIAGIVVLDEPEPIHYGGYTAGPTFKNIALKFAAVDHYEIPMPVDSSDTIPEDSVMAEEDEGVLVVMPDVTGVPRDQASIELAKAGLTPVFSGPGATVVGSRPAASSMVKAGSEVYCYVAQDMLMKKVAPDLTGLTIREAVAILKKCGMEFICTGMGRVVSQTPSAGEIVIDGQVVTFDCKRETGA